MLGSRFARVVFFLLLFSSFASASWGMEVPAGIRKFLQEKGRYDLIERFERVPVLLPQDFIQKFFDGKPGSVSPVGAGFNGIVFSNHKNEVIKINFAVMAALGKVKLVEAIRSVSDAELALATTEWAGLFGSEPVRNVDVPLLRKDKDVPLGSQRLSDELYGTLIWAAYNPERTEFPAMVTSDGLAFQTKFVRGVTLKSILESQREGTELHRHYNMKRVWKQVVFWQRVSELMVRDAGVTVDMFVPGNFMVDGSYDAPKIKPIDTALAKPSPEALEFYNAQGWQIPQGRIAESFRVIVWPTMPEHIVSSGIWNLSFDQALDFVQAYFDIGSRAEAAKKLSTFGQWSIIEAPFFNQYQNIEKARSRWTRTKLALREWTQSLEARASALVGRDKPKCGQYLIGPNDDGTKKFKGFR